MAEYAKPYPRDWVPDHQSGLQRKPDNYKTDKSQIKTPEIVAKIKKDNKFAADMWEVFDSAGNLLLKKHKDYGPTNISKSPGGPLNGLRVRMWDKTARLNHLIDNGATPENESLRDSFLDLLNYAAIALMVLDGKWPESND
jgi:hypothetical protein